MGSKKKGPSFLDQTNSLLSEISANKDITDETKSELTKQLNQAQTDMQRLSGSNAVATLNDAAAKFQQAKEGEGIFGSRQRRRDTILSRLDRPGLTNQLG